MPKLCAHTKCQWVVAIVSIISSRSESRQTRSLILCNALQSMLSDVFLSFGMRLLFTFQWANGFLFIGPPYIIYVIHVCVFIWKWCWHTYYTLHFTHTQRLMYVCLHKQASKKPMATALVYILPKHTHTFVCCAKWNEIILSVARKNILLHKMGQVTNLNNRVKCACGAKAPNWRCLCARRSLFLFI